MFLVNSVQFELSLNVKYAQERDFNIIFIDWGCVRQNKVRVCPKKSKVYTSQYFLVIDKN